MNPGIPAALAGRRRSTGVNPYDVWVAAVDAAGGTYESDSKTIASDLSDQLVAASYYSKIVWVLPLLGANLAAARVPLIDKLSVGQAGNVGFVDADFTQATGLQGNGSSKLLSSLIMPDQLGLTGNGGMGYWENNINFSGTSSGIMGGTNVATSTAYFALDLRTNPLRLFSWSNTTHTANDTSTAPTNGNYYGQRSSSTSREMFFDGTSIATNTASDGAGGANDTTIRVLGLYDVSLKYWAGRCAVAYLTDGTLSGADVSALHTLLDTYLITPTGR